jgi:hypothetical protein
MAPTARHADHGFNVTAVNVEACNARDATQLRQLAEPAKDGPAEHQTAFIDNWFSPAAHHRAASSADTLSQAFQ